MAKWARIENGIVVETIVSNPSGKYHPLIVWVSCPDSTSEGFTYSNGVFSEWQSSIDSNAIRANMYCGPLQIRKALRAAGLHTAVVAYVAGADEETQEAWEYAGEFRRLDPFILAAQVALNKTDEEVDDLFRLALTF